MKATKGRQARTPKTRVKLPRPGAKIKPIELTEDLTRRIVDAISSGASLATASNSVGLDPAVFARWLREPGEPYVTLQGLVRAALASPEIAMLTAAMLGAEKDPRIALEFLKVRYGDRYAPVDHRAPARFDYGAVLQRVWEERRQAEVEGASHLKQISDESAEAEIERLREQERAS